MALDKGALKNDIKQLLTDMESKETDAKEEFATRLADMIDTYVKGIEINYTTGLVSPPNGGAVTGVFEYTVS